MSHSEPMVIPASSEFVSICQAQIALLTQGLGAAWSAVYLTEELGEGAEAQLIPVAVYPQTTALTELQASEQRRDYTPRLLASADSQPIAAATQPTAIDAPRLPWEEPSWQKPHQIVLPLIYEEVMVGLLVTGRKDREWNQRELRQIEKMVKTLAIARLLDRRQYWYQQQLREEQQRQRFKGDRLDDLLHQLRNPLTALRTFSKLLLKRLLPQDSNRSIAQGMLRESDRLQELLQEFEANIEQIEREMPSLALFGTASALPEPIASPALDLEPIALAELLEPLLVSLGAIAQERGIELTADIPPHLAPVQANAKALLEVFSNLIDNALKYTPAGGKVAIEVGGEQITPTGRRQGIAISDTGYGIPAEDRERIFERHYRGVQEKGEIAGSGLGLAIVKELVERMAGTIEVTGPSEINQAPADSLAGTTFIIWLPVAREKGKL